MLGGMMKVKAINEDEIIVFLNKKYFYDLDLENDEKVEEYFRDIFKSLVNNYDIALNSDYLGVEKTAQIIQEMIFSKTK